MRSILFYIPAELAGLPVFGVGWLLAAWFAFAVVLLFLISRRPEGSREVAGYLPVVVIVAAVIAFLLPNSNAVPGRSASDQSKDAHLRGKISTLAEIERRKGVDLFPDMDPALKERLRDLRAQDLWASN